MKTNPRVIWYEAPMALPPRCKYPWRSLLLGKGFRVLFTVLELQYSKLATKRRKALLVRAYRMGRYGLRFSIRREKKGLFIKRIG